MQTNSEKITIVRTFGRDDEKKYFDIPFEVKENTERFNICIVLDNTKGTCVDFGLISPDGRQNGASGSRTKSLTVSAKYATDGYTPMEPAPGTWQIICGIYRVGTGVTVTCTVELIYKERRWLTGDTHVHTYHSDGNCSPAEILSRAKKKKLDYIILTDHNNGRAGTLNMTDPEVTVIKGMELTEYNGHCNFWGPERPVDGPYCASEFSEFVRLADEARENGAVISINHPCCKLCGWHWPLEGFPMDGMEVWNGPQRIDNMNALQLWHNELLKGRKIAACGGSDYHRDYYVTDLLAVPATVVYAESDSPAAILKALRNGNSVISCKPGGTFLTLACEGKTVGETLKWHEGSKVRLHVERLKKGQWIEVYNNDTIVFSAKAHGNTMEAEIPVREKGFVRAQVLFQRGKMGSGIHRFVMKFLLPPDAKLPVPSLARCITNPIWFD